MTEALQNDKQTWKGKLRFFSQEVFRNYHIMMLRWNISALERKRNHDIVDLGNRVFRLVKRKKIAIPDVELLIKSVEDMDSEIELKEEKLREFIMRGDSPKQIPESASSTDAPLSQDAELAIESEPVIDEGSRDREKSVVDKGEMNLVEEVAQVSAVKSEANLERDSSSSDMKPQKAISIADLEKSLEEKPKKEKKKA